MDAICSNSVLGSSVCYLFISDMPTILNTIIAAIADGIVIIFINKNPTGDSINHQHYLYLIESRNENSQINKGIMH